MSAAKEAEATTTGWLEQVRRWLAPGFKAIPLVLLSRRANEKIKLFSLFSTCYTLICGNGERPGTQSAAAAAVAAAPASAFLTNLKNSSSLS